jgi:hypothetical protein
MEVLSHEFRNSGIRAGRARELAGDGEGFED